MSIVNVESELLPRCSSTVCLRRMRASDLEDFQAYRLDPQVAALQGWVATTDAQAQQFLEDMAVAPLFAPTKWCQLGIAQSETNRLLGDIGLCLSEDGSQLELGISLSRAMQGHGLASAALKIASALVFEHSSAKRIVAITDLRNVSAQALLGRCGFAEVQRKNARFRDKPCIEIVYVLVK